MSQDYDLLPSNAKIVADADAPRKRGLYIGIMCVLVLVLIGACVHFIYASNGKEFNTINVGILIVVVLGAGSELAFCLFHYFNILSEIAVDDERCIYILYPHCTKSQWKKLPDVTVCGAEVQSACCQGIQVHLILERSSSSSGSVLRSSIAFKPVDMTDEQCIKFLGLDEKSTYNADMAALA